MKSLKITLLVALIAVTKLVSAQSGKSFQWIGGPTYILHLGSFNIN
jgi:N-acyl-phosphatidylethanolamine-hydrolysing phospholipase D